MPRFDQKIASELAYAACRGAGASEPAARSLAEATISAELRGKSAVVFRHLVDYLAALSAGRIAGVAEPELSSPVAAIIRSDARGGIAQLGFDRAFDDLRQRCAAWGVAIFAQHNSYTAGVICAKVARYAERLHHPERLTRPLIRKGQKGAGEFSPAASFGKPSTK